MKKLFQVWILLWMFPACLLAASHTYHLNVEYKNVNFTGSKSRGIAVNGTIPGPTLHFSQGELVTINVTNHLKEETAIHWHGLLVPWQMDGVKGVTQHGIKPGETFHYQFRVEQSGTYWYHAHKGLQEQSGLYGAIVIDPPQKPAYHYDKDFVVVLSDWSNTNPDQILANLKKTGEYYAPRFPLQASLMKFIHDYRKSGVMERKNLLEDYKMMQQMRMGIYDFSDVAYDAFLLNGRTPSSPWKALVKSGDVVRLRFIGAGASTIFNVKIPNHVMKLVHAQGNDIRPYSVNRFSIAPGETYDVLVKVEDNNPIYIYAESLDTAGAAYGAFITRTDQPIANIKTIKPFPEPQPVTRTMMQMMGDTMSMDHGGSMANHATMSMPMQSSASDDYMTSAGVKYEKMIAAVKTNHPDKNISEIFQLRLTGFMDKYIWMINDVPEYKAKPVILQPGKRYRFVFKNDSMMHHPMHIHGHWFILRNGHGVYDPLLHTLDIPPGATVTADLDTDASGQWLFHCHLLYHMLSGMSRVYQYSTLLELTHHERKPQNEIKQTAYVNRPIVRVDEVRAIDDELVKHPMPHEDKIWFASFLDLGFDPNNSVGRVTFKGLYGYDYNKLELFMNDAEWQKGVVENADLDIFYWRLIDAFWAVKGGVNYFYRPSGAPYWQPGIGIEGMLPYFIETDLRGYTYGGSYKLDAEFVRDTQITNNFFIKLGIRGILATATVPSAQLGAGLNQMRYVIAPFYRIAPGVNLVAEYEYERGYGAFRRLQLASLEKATDNTFTLGASFLF